VNRGKTILLKVCGMRDPGNIRRIISMQPDYMGFIFYEKSPRFVGNDFELASDFPAAVKKVGVFVNASTAQIATATEKLALDYLQLHGDESVATVKELKMKGYKLIKVFSIGDTFDFTIVEPYQEFVDFVLFDTRGKYYGGNAQRYDWMILEGYNQQVPFFLSGGLNRENVEEINQLDGMNLHALDVNRGVEDSPGLKNVEKVQSIVDFIKK
jgi:phosphoribosylanthranilate isomerase